MNLPHIPEEPKEADVTALLNRLMFGRYYGVGRSEMTLCYEGVGWSTNGAYGIIYRQDGEVTVQQTLLLKSA